MQKIKTILVCLDPTRDEQPALDKGIYLADIYQARLEILLVVYNRGLVKNLFFSEKELESAKQGYINTQKRWLKSYLAEIEKSQINYRYDIIWHKPLYEGVIQKAKAVQADLVIKSTHHHPTINKIFFTPNDWQLLKMCPAPLLLAKTTTGKSYHNILTAIDPTRAHDKPEELDDLIISNGIALAKSVDAVCHVAHCHEPISYQLWSDIGMGMGVGMGPADFTMGEENYSAYYQQIKQSQQKQFDKIIAAYNFDESVKHLEEGYPETELPQLVDQHAIDLLVLGSRQHSALIGTTAEKILDQVNCDILSVREESSDY